MTDNVPVLDKGYVRLVDCMGDDTTVVNAARVSFHKRIDQMTEQDTKLLDYLAKNDHTSPFRHAMLSFEVKAPLMVCRQWWKYVVGSDHTMDGWNEVSRRYVTEEPEFYIPAEWRGAPKSKKQGSDGVIPDDEGRYLQSELAHMIDEGRKLYSIAVNVHGVAAEQARLLLPAYGMYTTWIWTASLQSVLHFLVQRLDAHAQWEIRQYAEAVRSIAVERFPDSVTAWMTHRGHSHG